MKKAILYILMLAALFVSCQKVELGNTVEGQKVRISFNVQMPEAVSVTKALLDTPQPLSNLYVAVFDGNGYFIEYVRADQLTQSTENALEYTYSIELTSTDETRILHFIGNSPVTEMGFGQERALIASLQTSGDQDAYWQRKVLGSGISSNPAQVKAALGQIELVRNYAKVTVTTQNYNTAAKNFVLEGIKVYYAPDKAFVAPYVNNAGSFIMDYNSIDYDDLLTSFAGYVPQDAHLIGYQSGDEDTFSPVSDGKACAYVYERGNPATDKADWRATPMTIIIKGRYDRATSSTYYKINLMDDESNYYALLRNFNFNVNIHSVNNAGFTSIEAALNSAGSGDISRVLGYENVTNISDTESRMFIDKTSQVVISPDLTTLFLKYKYIPDVMHAADVSANDARDNDSAVIPSTNSNPRCPVVITVGEPTNGEVIKSVTVDDEDSGDGYRLIEIEVAGADAALIKRQKLTVTGFGKNSDGDYSGDPVSRTFEIIVRPTLKLTAQCISEAGNAKVAGTAGESLTVRLGVEDDLPASIFPLNLSIEAASMTLTPATGANLPVNAGTSISGSGKPAYQFVKTLTKEEYDAAPTFTAADGTVYRQIDCAFKTTVASSTSVVYVQNEYFNLASCGFSTGAFVFIDPAVDNTRVGASKAFLSFSTMDTTPVNVTLTGAKYNGSASFIYTPSSAGPQSIEVTPDAYGNGISFRLTATGYANAQSPVKYRYVEFQANTVGATFSKQPIAFGSANSVNLTLNLGLGYDISGSVISKPVFVARRVADGKEPQTFYAPTTANREGSRSANGNNGNPYLYTFRFDVTDYNPDYEYSYKNGDSFVAVTPTSVNGSTAHFEINSIPQNPLVFYVQKAGYVTLTLNKYNYYNSFYITVGQQGSGQADVTKYKYSAAGPSALTVVNFNSEVQSDTRLFLYFTDMDGVNHDYQGYPPVTVGNLATGTAPGGPYQIAYTW